MAEVNVFLDTMVYLRFVPLEQIDLCGVLGADRVTILVPRVTLKELEKHKINHASARSRDRARQALALLEKHVESGLPVRDGVAIAFIPHMPRMDMEQHGLNPLWNVDLLIASVLEYKTLMPSEETRLVTDDTGARLTCRHLGVRTAQLPDKYRLPSELGEDEKETIRLRRENEKLKNALPRLAIGFGDDVEPVGRLSLRAPEPVDEKRIAQKLSKLKSEFPELPEKRTLPSAAGDLSLVGLAGMLAVTDAFGGYS